jgi:hypothetical protein
MDACDLSKQGLESVIAPEMQRDPNSEVTDGCDPSKSALDKNKLSLENLIWMQMIHPNKRTRIRDKYRKPKQTRIRSYRWWSYFHECTRCQYWYGCVFAWRSSYWKEHDWKISI